MKIHLKHAPKDDGKPTISRMKIMLLYSNVKGWCTLLRSCYCCTVLPIPKAPWKTIWTISWKGCLVRCCKVFLVWGLYFTCFLSRLISQLRWWISLALYFRWSLLMHCQLNRFMRKSFIFQKSRLITPSQHNSTVLVTLPFLLWAISEVFSW